MANQLHRKTGSVSALVPTEFKSQTPARLRLHAQRYGDKLSQDLQQALLDAASEIEGSEEAFATAVDQKRELQQ